MIGILESKRKQISEACSGHGVARLHVFGSALNADFRSDESDLDLLVEFLPMEPYARVEAYFGLLEELRSLFNMKVDLVMIEAVKNPYIAREIERTKEVLYAA
jgi:predicted nucleotidyltransferase